MSFRLLLVVLFGIGAAYLVMVAQIELDPWSAGDTINSRTLPQIYGVMLCLAVLAMAFGGQSPQGPVSGPAKRKVKRLAWLSTLICAFIVSLLWLNLWIALASLLFGGLLTMGEKRWSMICVLSLGIPLAGFVLVQQVLMMTIPLS